MKATMQVLILLVVILTACSPADATPVASTETISVPNTQIQVSAFEVPIPTPTKTVQSEPTILPSIEIEWLDQVYDGEILSAEAIIADSVGTETSIRLLGRFVGGSLIVQVGDQLVYTDNLQINEADVWEDGLTHSDLFWVEPEGVMDYSDYSYIWPPERTEWIGTLIEVGDWKIEFDETFEPTQSDTDLRELVSDREFSVWGGKPKGLSNFPGNDVEDLIAGWSTWANATDWNAFRQVTHLPTTAGEYYSQYHSYLEEKNLTTSSVSLDVSIFASEWIGYYEHDWDILIYEPNNIPNMFRGRGNQLGSSVYVLEEGWTLSEQDVVGAMEGTNLILTFPDGDSDEYFIPQGGIYVILIHAELNGCECFSPIASWSRSDIYRP